MLDTVNERFDLNIKRVENLVGVYVKLRGTGKGKRKISQTDVLRSSVVLLHATLEEFLRGLARWKLPSASEDRLNKLPLVGEKTDVLKFSWGQLSKHKAKTIEKLLGESIEHHLDHSNYNDTKDVVQVLELIGVDKAKVESHFANMTEAMKRRHAIVHQADRQAKPGKGYGKAQPIDEVMVNSWISAIKRFKKKVVKELT